MSSWDSVELAVLCEADHIDTNDQVATATKCAEILVAEYKNVVCSIRRDLFMSASLHDDMKMRMKGGQKNGFNAKTLWEKWRATQTEMKKIMKSTRHLLRIRMIPFYYRESVPRLRNLPLKK